MGKKDTTKYFLGFLAILSVVAGVLGWGILYYILPEYYFSWYPAIPVYFFIFGLLYIFLFNRYRSDNQQRIVLFYTSIRMMKLMVSIVALILYGLLIKEQMKELLFTFIIFYLVYLVFETLFFFNFEKTLRKKKAKSGNETSM